ncbi:hypothetical protein PBAL39_00847 [Pedobacter sp. BAL39]|nr:hypothetical protein PBAL39_00847 [Pedobacter sp. BAL39]
MAFLNNLLKNTMKRIIIYLLMGASLTSCAQKEKKMNTASIADLYKEVKFKEQKISYRAGIQVGACNFQLLINDVPVAQNFGDVQGTFSTSSPINSVLLKGGRQTFKLLLYPGFHNNQPLTTLSENVRVRVAIEGLKYEGEGVKTVVSPYEIIQVPSAEEPFVFGGKPTAVYEGTFSVNLPYEVTGWSKSKDLRKEDPDVLLKQVLAANQYFSNLITKKDEQGLQEMVYQKEKNYAQMMFLDQAATANQWASYTQNFKDPTLEMRPLEHYRLKFYGDGRLVTLERTDIANLGEPALRARYQENGRNMINAFYLYLHKPEGSDKLEVIH